MLDRIATVLQWTLVVAIVFLLAKYATGVSQVITSFGSFWTSETKVLTGQ